MIKTNILTSEETLLSTVFGPYDMLIQAGMFWNTLVGEPLTPKFEVSITNLSGQEICGLAGARIQPHRAIEANDDFDLIIIPSEGVNIQPDSDSFRQRAAYVKAMHEKGAVVASVCTGAFLLAATGLLDGKEATTHWALASQFNALYPNIKLNTDLLIADSGSVVTAGGISADQDLSMHLISRFCGQETALQTARCTLVNPNQRSQSPFKTFIVNTQHGDETILKCQQLIEEQLGSEITVSSLSDLLAMGTRTLNRRFKQATGHSVIHYIQMSRVERAKHILEREVRSFDSIANELGYDNVSFFRRLFKKQVGLSPKEYRRIFVNP